jgi:hypothetical protein
MKPWQLNHKIGNLTRELDDSANSKTRIDYSCLTEPERALFERVQEILDKYAPANPPHDVIAKNGDLWNKGLEIFARRAVELFVEVMPASLCCDELEEWYFKLYFYNFLLDWTERVQKLREMPKKRHDELLCERKEMGMLDIVFRIPRSQHGSIKKKKTPETHSQ